ncbi:MAG: ABC transporter substrate-binding protein [Deltaproteobacteria bacterium]|nr:ABC transporter substrate-binding protein [Deltaproteobacteria bacterium]
MKNRRVLLITGSFVLLLWFPPLTQLHNASAQEPKRIALCFSGTGINQYVLGITQKHKLFLRNGVDPLIVYIGSGSLMSQALVAGTFDMALSIGSESIVTKLRGADRRIIAVIANHFNHVYITRPEITSIRELRGGKVAISRFGSGSEFMTDLVLKEGGLNPKKDVTMLQIGNSSARLAALLRR